MEELCRENDVPETEENPVGSEIRRWSYHHTPLTTHKIEKRSKYVFHTEVHSGCPLDRLRKKIVSKISAIVQQ